MPGTTEESIRPAESKPFSAATRRDAMRTPRRWRLAAVIAATIASCFVPAVGLSQSLPAAAPSEDGVSADDPTVPVPSETDSAPPSATELSTELEEAIRAGDSERSLGFARQLAEAIAEGEAVDDPATTALRLARAARLFQKSPPGRAGDTNERLTAELYHAAWRLSERSEAAGLTPAQRESIRLATASALLRAGALPAVVECLQPVSEPKGDTHTSDQIEEEIPEGEIPEGDTQRTEIPEGDTQQKIPEEIPEGDTQQKIPEGDTQRTRDPQASRLAAQMLLSAGSAALRQGDAETARQAYANCLKILSFLPAADPNREATAMLGHGWALAVAGDRPLQAARALSAFVDRYPDHGDAPHAVRAAATCLGQAGRDEDADRLLSDLLERWPHSGAASAVVREHVGLEPSQLPAAVARWLLARAADRRPLVLEAPLLALGARVAAERDEAGAWSWYTARLAAEDASGGQTRQLLAQWSETHPALAERFAARLISGEADQPPTVSAREAACLWAGRQGRWTMLALASEAETPDEPAEHRSVTIERLFAESLMQTGRSAEARAWWEHLADRRGCHDFPTLLRCAETSVASAPVDQAASRIETARGQAAAGSLQVALVDALDAELAIRRARFEQARESLESVIRHAASPGTLRARAQFLIGETYFLQQQYAEAIEAYRLVEGMDDDGSWIPASLVQAGKSFEQLGRTHEATLCYWSLVDRFGDSPHARSARRRLAALSPEQPTREDTLRR